MHHMKNGIHHKPLSILVLLLTMSLTGLSGCQPAKKNSTGAPIGSAADKSSQTQLQKEVPQETDSPEEPLRFADKGFQQAINDALSFSKDTSDEEKRKAMAQASSLEIDIPNEVPIHSLEDLCYFSSLETLQISYFDQEHGEGITDYSGIQSAQKLKTLLLSYQDMKDLSFLQSLVNLKELHLRNCKISDLSALKNASHLEQLSLYGVNVEDAAVFEKLTNLSKLSLNKSSSPLKNYNSLKNLTHIRELELVQCGIQNMEFIRFMPELESLILDGNQIGDISPLEGLRSLDVLHLSNNQISDISVLSGLSGLCYLSLDGNHIEDISPLKNLMLLNSLELSDNPVKDLSCLSDKKNLLWLSIRSVPIKNIEPVLEVPILQFGPEDDPDVALKHPLIETAKNWIQKKETGLAYYCINDLVTGDLNCDGREDLAFVVSELSPDTKKKKSKHPVQIAASETTKQDYYYKDTERRLIVLLKQKDGGYQPLDHNLWIGSYYSGGTRGDPYRGILINQGYLLIQEAGGSCESWTNTQYYQCKKNTLELIQEIDIGNDNFYRGFDASITKYPENKTQRNIFALDDDYHYICLSMEGSEKLKGAPDIDLFNRNGDYHYYKENRTPKITASEALALAANEFEQLSKELSIPVKKGEVLRKMNIGYTPKQKELFEHLRGIDLPEYFYGCGEESNPSVILGYDSYGYDEKNPFYPFHRIFLNYYNDSQHESFEEIIVYDKTGVVALQ